MNVHRTFLLLGATAGFLGVAMGAFGAHGLRATLDDYHLAIFRTGVDYQMWHALALTLVGMMVKQFPGTRLLVAAGWLLFAGIVLFSGSLYILSIGGIRWLGWITPFGGMAFLVGWLLLGLSAWRLEN
ncbi:Uncharacterized membrane protein YgdD (TMEM256/DUF423 family) [Methylocaldum szegediense]|uniref:Uncharacterized membrane protein YgdD (TMEM256/DUF423 family) n=1 Tax=Methylocaldum szegediense TaxID=73780 RepID=A0ABN8X188_9GAMM|nr:Uncharacterized membrane protein YgdD (TMEM256/DUF423 family) [Methylocaldum szegediense]